VNRPRPAWSLTDVDVERMIAVFARTLARALAEELRRDHAPAGKRRDLAPDHEHFAMGPIDRAPVIFNHLPGCECGCQKP
jgi:hypothetical protein